MKWKNLLIYLIVIIGEIQGFICHAEILHNQLCDLLRLGPNVKYLTGIGFFHLSVIMSKSL